MKKLFLILAVLLYAPFLSAADAEFPALTGPVVDNAGLLTTDQNRILSAKLLNFHKTKGSQIAVCIVPTIQPLTIEDYGIQLAQRWKIGRDKIDDGIIIIVAKNDRKMRIEVGYGLEHVVTDLRAGRIVDYMMVPEFRKGDFYKGIDSAVDSLITYINGGDIPALAASASNAASITPVTDDTGFNIGMGFIIGSIVLFIVLMAMGKTLLSILLTYIPFTIGLYLMGSGTISESAVFGGFSMLPFAFIAVMMKFAPAGTSSGSSGYSSSSYSSSSDSYSSSSSSSDSFSGGGGDFGGGGASGDW
jgi:uncharacterized protein